MSEQHSPGPDSGHFGSWITDPAGLPAYLYTCQQDTDPVAKTPTTWGESIDHFHQLGNDRLTATAHNGGYVQVLDSSRGFLWLTYREPESRCLGGGIVFICEQGETWSDAWDTQAPEEMTERVFGTGYFKKVRKHRGLCLSHTVCLPFSDDPVVVSEIEITNQGSAPRSFILYDYWGVHLRYLSMSLVVTSHNRRKFGRTPLLQLGGHLAKWAGRIGRFDTDTKRRRFSSKFLFQREEMRHGLVLIPEYYRNPPVRPDQASGLNYYPKPMFLCLLNEAPDEAYSRRASVFTEEAFHPHKTIDGDLFSDPCLVIGKRVSLEPGEKKRFSFLFGAAPQVEIEGLRSRYEGCSTQGSIQEKSGKDWKRSVVHFENGKDAWLTRELEWHSYYLRSASFFDEFSGCHKQPQGSVYAYGHGFDGALRDFMLFLYPMIYLSPALAKEVLIYVLKLMKPDGSLPYGVYGVGTTVGALIHEDPSDVCLWVLWGILEYITLTRDFAFLEEEVPFVGPRGEGSSVRSKMGLLIDHLFSERVGLGPHGVIRAGSGDWSDGISFMVKSRRRFIKHGESLFNTGFAIALFSQFDLILSSILPDKIWGLREKVDSLKVASQKAWNGRWFYRGWDGQGNAIGDRELFLEHHNWLLIGQWLPEEQVDSVLRHIVQTLDDPAKTGQFVLYPPVKTMLNVLAPGWDVNGGIWHAMNTLLTWAYALHDPDKAWQSLWKNSMANRAQHYPHLWYGIWSGPDSTIADYAPDAGQAFYHLPTPMRDWPLMNLNLHANFISSFLRILGVTGTQDGLSFSPRFPENDFRFSTPLLDLERSKGKTLLRYRSPHWTKLSVDLGGLKGTLASVHIRCQGATVKEGVAVGDGRVSLDLERKGQDDIEIEIHH